ncbi:helix-turn-helix domain-containing protein, partial [Mesorhizobium sp. L103C120A0]|uniref:helix-turn-helix domain-containing protein n=1 Tax=Mesorhizobium sp. L103C120A0 TaxID=1287086 RepID=UPI001FD9B241
MGDSFLVRRRTWLGRYRTFGPEGLHDLPRAPLNHGRATAQDLVERIVAAKELHPLWGPKKIVARLRRTAPEFLVRFIKLGITLERIAPGRPQQNGRHERFHLT